MKAQILIAILLLIPFYSFADRINIDHYSVNEGLTENTVICMHQDRKGIMWFGTFAGLNRFDGYRFRTYKVNSDAKTGLSHNRVDKIMEDTYGFLWLMNYNGGVQRFDPRTEEFLDVPDFEQSIPANNSPIVKIRSFASGEIWLITKSNGVYCVETNPNDYSLKVTHFGKENKRVNTDFVNDVYKDWEKNVWLLTGNGLVQVYPGSHSMSHYFEENQENSKANQHFFSAMELDSNILFGSTKGRIWCYSKSTQNFELYKSDVSSNIIDIKNLSDGNFLLLTSGDGFIIWNKHAGTFRRINKTTCPQMPSNEMTSCYIDRFGDIWIETSANGVVHYNFQTDKLDYFRVQTDMTSPYLLLPNFIVFEDKRNTLWVHPRGGGFSYYDRKENKLQSFYNSPDSPDRKFSNLMHSAMSDAQGNLWMCTFSKGIEKVSFLRSDFNLVKPNLAKKNCLYENEVRSAYEDMDGNIWISTKDASLYLLDKNFNKIGYLTKDGKISNTGDRFRGLVYSIKQDNRKRLWLGTKGLGLFELVKKPGQSLEYSIKNYVYHKDDMYSLSNDNIYSIYLDKNDRVWIGTWGGGLNLMDESGPDVRFINSRNNLRSFPISQCNKIRYITADADNNIWIATTNGLVMFENKFLSPGVISFNHILPNVDNPESLSTYDINYIYCTRNNELFFGTSGGGLNKLVGFDNGQPKFKIFSRINGAPSDVILNITEDSRGKLWMASANGLLSFNNDTEQFSLYDSRDGLECTDFTEGSIVKLAGNRLGVGSNEGMYVFNPGKILKNTFVPPLIFTDFQLFNESVEIGIEDSPLAKAIDYTEHITLDEKESVFSITFAALDMQNTQRVDYAYRMKGFDKDWTISRNHPSVTYTNLPAGDYIFEVKSTNSDGVWVDNNRQIKITVLPPFWKSPWAYALYVLFVFMILGLGLYLQYMFLKLKNKVAVEHKVSNMKLRFFTDISHELRTPLTLIASPVEYMIKNEELSETAKDQLHIVQRNVDRMLRLINQILDFRKIQNEKMKLKIERIQIGSFTSQVCENFMRVANDKNIKFVFKDNSSDQSIWADKDKVEKILFNLMANAFKFTPSGNHIEVEVFRTDYSVSIRVQDEGVGISKEKLSRLFERYDSSMSYDGFQSGTGIGLSLTKELVDMHQATILADSQLGKGTWFTVSFRLGTKHFDGNVDFVVEDGENPELSSESLIEHKTEEIGSDKQTILIVEDNDELRGFLKTVLEKDYRVVEARNGKIGIHQAFETLPDIIVSDVMMPDVDGLQLTKSIKEDIRTSHTPVVLLTARTAMEDKLEALNSGADDYITKPFSAEYLEARIKNILQQRQKLQHIFCNNITFDADKTQKPIEITPSAPTVASHDDMFIEKLVKTLEDNMENSELTVEDLVSLVGLSRSVFFKKLKSLTGLAPIEFIREMRIKRAAQLIETRQFNISQVAYMVGMNDPRYFSRCFKQKYGMTPTEYKEQCGKK